MGGLFVPYTTKFLADFTGWFVELYDDRFVRLDQVMSSQRFLPSCISKPALNEPIYEMEGSLWDYSQEIDLKKTFVKKKIQNISQLQVLFRIGSGETIFVENFTCNNPFALMGRFGNDEEIASYFKKSNSPNKSQEVLYADILIQESKKSQVICSHRNLFEHAIDCTGQIEGKGIIPLSDLWLGMDDGKFKIFSKSLNKQIIPIVQHPLNPTFISHPMCRVLWEIAQQDSFRFQLHTNSILSKGKFCPKFTWGDICLQRPIWTVSSYDIKEKGSLKQLKEQWQIPDLISFGNNDRELILDLNDPIDCSIFHQEIVSKKTCTISTAEWINKSPIQTIEGHQVYPQFLKSWNLEEMPKESNLDFNFQSTEEIQWLYVRIFLNDECLFTFLEYGLGVLVRKVKCHEEIICWYFLYYRTTLNEIRLRFKVSNSYHKSRIKAFLFKELDSYGMVESFRFESYYPELEKFGGGMEDSETLFEKESKFFLESQKTIDLEKASIMAYLFFLLFRDHTESEWLTAQTKEGQKTCNPILKTKFKGMIENQKSILQVDFVKEYLKRMKSHPLYSRPSKPIFLIHHFHLFANRMFQNRCSEQEPFIYYSIYRQLRREEAGILRAEKRMSNSTIG